MKMPKIGLATITVLTIGLLLPLTPPVRGEIASTKWINTTFSGFDPFFQTTVDAYATGVTATLSALVRDNVGGAYINLTSWTLSMDWNQNYTGTLSQHIISGNQAAVTITFTVPSTSTASNLVLHNCIFNCLSVNYTTAAGVKNRQFFSPISDIAVYSSDQSSAMGAAQQLSFLTLGPSVCSSFKTSSASSSCLQAIQQANLGSSLYRTGNFAGANTDLQTALTDWNNAVNNENSAGGSLTLGSTVGGWGSLLLGIGAVVVGAAAIIYAIRRPKELRAAAAGR